jgi:hypothetical protein
MELQPTNKTIIIKGTLKKELSKGEKKQQKEEKTEGILDKLVIWKIGKEVEGFLVGQEVMLRRGCLMDTNRMVNAKKTKAEPKTFYLIIDPEEILGFWQ